MKAGRGAYSWYWRRRRHQHARCPRLAHVRVPPFMPKCTHPSSWAGCCRSGLVGERPQAQRAGSTSCCGSGARRCTSRARNVVGLWCEEGMHAVEAAYSNALESAKAEIAALVGRSMSARLEPGVVRARHRPRLCRGSSATRPRVAAHVFGFLRASCIQLKRPGHVTSHGGSTRWSFPACHGPWRAWG